MLHLSDWRTRCLPMSIRTGTAVRTAHISLFLRTDLIGRYPFDTGRPREHILAARRWNMAGNQDVCDHIIADAGSTGCVLANRLGEDPAVRILVLEAGGSDRALTVAMPAALSYPMNSKRFNRAMTTEPEPGLDGRAMNLPRGKRPPMARRRRIRAGHPLLSQAIGGVQPASRTGRKSQASGRRRKASCQSLTGRGSDLKIPAWERSAVPDCTRSNRNRTRGESGKNRPAHDGIVRDPTPSVLGTAAGFACVTPGTTAFRVLGSTT